MATNGLNKITEKILSAAEESAQKILDAAQAECECIAADYETRAAEIRRARSRDAEQRTADLLARAASTAAMQGRNLVGEKRSELIDGVFQRAYESIGKRSKAEYTDLLIGLLVAAMQELAET